MDDDGGASHHEAGQNDVAQAMRAVPALQAALGPLERARVADEARVIRERRQLSRDIELARLRRALPLLEASLREECKHSTFECPNLLKSVRYSKEDVEELRKLFEEKYVGRRTLLTKMFAVSAYAEEPAQAMKACLDVVGDSLNFYKREDLPGWAKHMCYYRDRFVCTAIAAKDDDNVFPSVVFLLLSLKVTPREVTWLRYERREDWQWMLDDNPDPVEDQCEAYAFQGTYVPLTSSLHLPDVARIVVLHGLSFRGSFFVAPHDPVPFEEFTFWQPAAMAPERARADRGHKDTVKAGVFAKLVIDHPWISPEAFDVIWRHREKKVEEEEEKEEFKRMDKPKLARRFDDLVDDALGDIDVAAEIRDARERVEDLGADESRHFYVKLLAGASTEKLTGVFFDRVAVRYRAHVRPFADLFHFCPQMSYTIWKYGSEENCKQLCEEVCRRATLFYLKWLDHGSPAIIDFGDFNAEYPDSLEFLTWATGLSPHTDEAEESHTVQFCVPVAK